jgi:Fic family protein
MLKNFHYLILKSIDSKNAWVYRKENVIISGAEIKPKDYINLEKEMKVIFNFYNQNKKHSHPVIIAWEVHQLILLYYPFLNWNNIVSKLIMNFILLKNGYPITIFTNKSEWIEEYYNSLRKIKNSWNIRGSLLFIAKNVEKSLENHLEFLS